MRKPRTNKRVTRALAVGLAIMLAAMSTPTMITATEGEGNEVNINIPKAVTAEPVFKVLSVSAASVGTAKFASISKPVTLGAEENEAGLEQAIEDVGAAIIPDDVTTPEVTGQVYDAVVSADSLAKETVPEFTVSSNHTLSDNTTTAVNDLKKNLEDNKDVTKNTLSANSYVEGAKDDLTTALTTTKNADDEMTLSVNIAKNLGDIAVSAGNLNAQAVDQAGTNASNTIDNQESIINSATTHEAVDNAVKVAKAAAKSAQDVYNEKLKDFNAKKAAYDEALKEVEAKKAAFDKAVRDAAENKKGAQEKLDKAEKELKDAQDQLTKLEGEVKKAQDAVDTAEKDKKEALEKKYDADKNAVQLEYDSICEAVSLSVNNAIAQVSANQLSYNNICGYTDETGKYVKGSADIEYQNALDEVNDQLIYKKNEIAKNYNVDDYNKVSENAVKEKKDADTAKTVINSKSASIYQEFGKNDINKDIYNLVYNNLFQPIYSNSYGRGSELPSQYKKYVFYGCTENDGSGVHFAVVRPNRDDFTGGFVDYVIINIHFREDMPGYASVKVTDCKDPANEKDIYTNDEYLWYTDAIAGYTKPKDKGKAEKTISTAKAHIWQDAQKACDEVEKTFKLDETDPTGKTYITYSQVVAKLGEKRDQAKEEAANALNNAKAELTNANTYKEKVIGKFDDEGKLIKQGTATEKWAKSLADLLDTFNKDTTAAGDEANYIRSEINVKFAPLYNQAAELKEIIAKAEKRVAELKDEIAKIKEVPENAADKFATKKLGYLEKELKDAEAELKESGDKLAVLNDKIARIETAAANRNNWITEEALKKQQEEWGRMMASRAMTGIAQEASSDESHSSSSSSSSGSSSEPSYVVPATTATIAPVVPTFDLASAGAPVTRARTVTRRRGVAGVRNNNTNSDADANAEALDAEVKEEVPAVQKDLTAMADNKANKAEDPGLVIGKGDTDETKQFTDNEIPLSSGSLKKSPVSSAVVAVCVGSVAIAGAGAAFVTASRRKKLALSESIKNLDK